MPKMALWPVLSYVPEVKEKRGKTDGFRRKLEFTEVHIMLLSAYLVKLKIRKMFVNEKIRQESFVKIYEIYIFISTTKIKVDKNAHNYIQFRFDV